MASNFMTMNMGGLPGAVSVYDESSNATYELSPYTYITESAPAVVGGATWFERHKRAQKLTSFDSTHNPYHWRFY
jgi:hypothetical protein